jgi:UDP-N-acetylmuramate: L-alanyl-gamma-D-glutamyl-meso-diaminopimelate ligase
MDKKHIHFIGICGVGMSALAILWQKKGWRVTGSDVGFYPPVSTHLNDHKISYYPGWHVEKMGKPDLVIIGNVAGNENPELKHVLENNIPHLSYPELIAQNLIKQNSIVCAGTFGKTTTTAMLAFVLKEANLDPAYMFGGISNSLSLSADDLGGDYSVIEGDEYKTSRDDLRAKFFSYHPTHLLLTGIKWDHADVYPTQESYLEAFKKLVSSVPTKGLIVACIDDENIKKILTLANAPVVTYGHEKSNYIYEDIVQSKNGIEFTIENFGEAYNISSPMLGDFTAKNICGVFIMAKELGVEPKRIIEAIKKFQGIKRRLDKRGQTVLGADVYDDIAHSPAKAQAVLTTLKNIYRGKIYAVFEPNTGNRQTESFADYDHRFANADEVIIPRLTKIKTPGSIEGKELSELIAKTHPNVRYFDQDEELVDYLKKQTQADDAIIFMGSHSFRGMIDELIKKYEASTTGKKSF